MPVPYRPHNRAQLEACFGKDIDDIQKIEVKPDAAKLLGSPVRTVRDVLACAWPYGRLRIWIERRQPLIEVVIEAL
jgi:hypothetical protein